jgi:hypothetical protein
MLQFVTRQQCEQFQMMHFGISCATCERWDEECPWHRQDEPPMARPTHRSNVQTLPLRFGEEAIPVRMCGAG